MQNLAKHELVISHRGVNGGFALKKSWEEITIFEIVVAAEENTNSFECAPSLGSCPNQKLCLVLYYGPLLNNLQFKVNDFLQKLTLKILRNEIISYISYRFMVIWLSSCYKRVF